MFTWENLWKAFDLLPGTIWPRVALTLWEFLLWGIVALGALLAAKRKWYWLPLAWALAFGVHEVAFRPYVLWVAGIPEAEDGDRVGLDSRAVLTLERWTGPVK